MENLHNYNFCEVNRDMVDKIKTYLLTLKNSKERMKFPSKFVTDIARYVVKWIKVAKEHLPKHAPPAEERETTD